MLATQINSNNEDLRPIKTDQNYKDIKQIEEKVNKSKSKLDKIYTREFAREWRKLDYFLNERRVVAAQGNTINISNAWLKCYEIVDYFDLIPASTTLPFVHFDNAAFPGSFILSVHHFINTHRIHLREYEWLGSSLLERDSADFKEKGLVADDYNLFRNYPENWLMGNGISGDVTDMKTLEHLQKKAQCDLYTSDLGFDVSSDYNEQEKLQFVANVGQIISGLITLKPGGSLVTKQYSFFNRETIAMMFVISQLFDEFYVCKPATSRPRNTETYLVGKGLKKKLTLSSEEIESLVKVLMPAKSSNARIALRRTPVAANFIELLHVAAIEMLERSASEINSSINMVKKMMSGEDKGVVPRKYAVSEVAKKWHNDHIIKPIPDKCKLNMRSAVGQQGERR
jgi:cap2 methyltransferase